MTPTAKEVKAHLVASGMDQAQMFIAFRAIDKAYEEALERHDRQQEADRARVVDLIRGAMV